MRSLFPALSNGITGLAITLLVSVGLTLSPPAHADQGNCPRLQACTTWCPGDPNPAGRPVPWDGSVCHDYYWDSYGVHDVGTGAFYSWATMPW
ncbi:MULTISPECIES: hypothetical protein [unclassified Mycobacterium]|uniref:hypothetical protein n=1 Tax=unclassified Mycobacterium TaxID=2642494 RepID=UPI000FAC89EE|nr:MULTISPECIES: hypothetical protein [unclassified Mycobacterium]MDP7705759.1 hypothetical protein [Mycobacterium sp. TY815]MDP7725230.1 hypothetical protein [Mycobacterium sp. TY814]RUP01403.1 MAG: hypothetical protein EKK34_29385 [Mycobacterium sp.]